MTIVDILPLLEGRGFLRWPLSGHFGWFLLLTALLHRSLHRRSWLCFRTRQKHLPCPAL
jgi:hypothetical protein